MRSGLPARSARRSPVGAGSSGTCACRPLHKVGDHVSALLLQPSRQNTPAVFISSLSPHLPQLHLLCFSPCLSSSSPCFMFPHGSYRDLASRCVSSRKIQPPVPGERSHSRKDGKEHRSASRHRCGPAAAPVGPASPRGTSMRSAGWSSALFRREKQCSKISVCSGCQSPVSRWSQARAWAVVYRMAFNACC